MTSFQRQLNLYGFRRVLKGDDEGAYFHPKFQRGKKELIPDIQRLPAKQSLIGLQEIMNLSQQAGQSTSSSKKKKTSPQRKRKSRGRAGSISSSSDESEEQKAEEKREIPVCLFMNNGRPKRQVQVAAETAQNNALQAGLSGRSAPRGALNPEKQNHQSQSSGTGKAANGDSARGAAQAQMHSPLSSIHSTSTDGESSGAENSHHKFIHHHRHPRSAHKRQQDPTTPVNQSFGSSSSTHVPHLKMPSYDETHDDILDLSLTSPLFANEMMDAPSTARLCSPTALARNDAQAGFDSVSAVDCQPTTDFAGLSSTQQDLGWSSHYYSLGALGRLPLITDYSPKVSSNPCLTVTGSSASASANSSAPKHISYTAAHTYHPMMRSTQSVPAHLHQTHNTQHNHTSLFSLHSAQQSTSQMYYLQGQQGPFGLKHSSSGGGSGAAGPVHGVTTNIATTNSSNNCEPSGIWLGDPLDDLLDFFEPSPEATMTGFEVGVTSSSSASALPAFPPSGLTNSAASIGAGAAGSEGSAYAVSVVDNRG